MRGIDPDTIDLCLGRLGGRVLSHDPPSSPWQAAYTGRQPDRISSFVKRPARPAKLPGRRVHEQLMLPCFATVPSERPTVGGAEVSAAIWSPESSLAVLVRGTTSTRALSFRRVLQNCFYEAMFLTGLYATSTFSSLVARMFCTG